MLPAPEYIAWLLDTWQWLLASFGGAHDYRDNGVVATPTEEDFPVDADLTGHELALDYFGFVLEHARLSDWRFELAADDQESVAEMLRGIPHHMTDAAVPLDDADDADVDETYDAPRTLPIPYRVDLLSRSHALVAHLARGAAHYWVQSAPGGVRDDDTFEQTVDVAAVFLGFGIFTANAAFDTYTTESGMLVGWGYARQGTLSELELSYALALHATLLEVDHDDVLPHLKPNPRAYFRAAVKDLRRRAEVIDRLREVRDGHDGPYR